MTVISRNTAFTYKGKAVATRQIGRELGVRYVLEGSIRHSDNRVRVNAQLIHAETNSHLWAERFDRSAEDLFALQDEITNWIAKALNVELPAAEAARPVEHLDALDCILRGRAAANKSRSLAALDEAIRWYERALVFDPASTEAQTHLAAALAYRIQDFVPESSDADIERAEKLARQAIMSSPRSARAHNSMAEVLRTQRKYTEAISEYEAALALDRNFVNALAAMGRCKTYIGPVDDAILAQQCAIRLSPRDPALFNWYFRNRRGSSAAIARRSGNPLARKGAQQWPGDMVCACLACSRLRPQGRPSARSRRTRRRNGTSGKRVRARHCPYRRSLLGPRY